MVGNAKCWLGYAATSPWRPVAWMAQPLWKSIRQHPPKVHIQNLGRLFALLGRSPKEIHTQGTQRHVPECLWQCYAWQDKLEATPMAVNNKLDEKYGEPDSREHSEPRPRMFWGFTDVLLHILLS